MQNKNSYIERETENLIYYNSTFVNETPFIQRASITETRTSPILKNCSDWIMSIIRFDVDCRTIPINLPQTTGPAPSPPYPVKSSYTTSFITLKYLGIYYTQQVVYTETASPPYPLMTQATIYNYQKWLDFVNIAAAAAFIATGVVGSPPQFIYNPETGLINLYIDKNFVPSQVVNPITIFFNYDLSSYFQNFQYDVNTEISLNPLYGFRLKINDANTIVEPNIGSRQGLPISVQTIPNTLYMCEQTAKGTAAWSSLRSIILSSTLLPIRAESIPNLNGTSSNQYLGDNLFPIISDFVVPLEATVTDFRVVNIYLPTGQYRYLDLVSSQPLTTVDISIYWSDFAGNIYPLFIDPQSSMSVKILFQKKRVISSI